VVEEASVIEKRPERCVAGRSRREEKEKGGEKGAAAGVTGALCA
jgi:hypothetical protein